mmetsp:Transcript_24813/g.45509  ORF Transcript_24813/g.45509 Transcript_24813/m.45509 type:complete len:238 (+) Transcript_24813:1235-1948(+)
MQHEHTGELANAQALLSFLKTAATFAKELVACPEQLCGLECSQTCCQGCMAFNINRQVKEGLPTHSHSLTAKTSRLIHKHPLEDVMHPSSGFILLPVVLCQPLVVIRSGFLPHSFAQVLHDVIEKELQELVRILVLSCAEEVVALANALEKPSWCDASNGTLLVLNLCKELGQANKQRISRCILLQKVLYSKSPEGGAEVEGLEDAVQVACVRHVYQAKELLAVGAQAVSLTISSAW